MPKQTNKSNSSQEKGDSADPEKVARGEEPKNVQGDDFEKEQDEHLPGSQVMDGLRDLGRQVEDGVMSFFPVEVTEHLVKSRKELIKAALRVGEMRMERLDEKLERARKLHEEEEAQGKK